MPQASEQKRLRSTPLDSVRMQSFMRFPSRSVVAVTDDDSEANGGLHGLTSLHNEHMLVTCQVTEWPRGVFPGLEVTVAAPLEGDARWRASIIPQLHFALSKRGHVALKAFSTDMNTRRLVVGRC